MVKSVLFEVQFLALVIFSVILPVSIYGYMMFKKAISRRTVLFLGVLLITISGIDIVLLQQLGELAKKSSSLLDDWIFASELSVALYLLPALFAGIGVNLISHILVSHLADAERRFDQEVQNFEATQDDSLNARHDIDPPKIPAL